MVLRTQPKTQPKTISLKNFHNRKNKALIYRTTGGLGDILMHRMIFEDFKKIEPNMHLTFACLPYYKEAVIDHPFLDEIISCENINQEEYGITFNTTSACDRYECGRAPFADKHRSDIWAGHCGIQLKNHNMHLQLTPEELEYGKNWLMKNKNTTGPTVMFCPISAMASKNLLPNQIEAVLTLLKNKNCFVFTSHHKPSELDKKIPVLYKQTIRQWMSLIAAADYVVTVDTAAFHLAGGLNKPLTGIFTWADGYVYSKYYSTATIVQLHRNTHPQWLCGPCYSWTNCPKTKNPLKPCLTEISKTMMLEGIKKMMTKYPLSLTNF